MCFVFQPILVIRLEGFLSWQYVIPDKPYTVCFVVIVWNDFECNLRTVTPKKYIVFVIVVYVRLINYYWNSQLNGRETESERDEKSKSRIEGLPQRLLVRLIVLNYPQAV